MSESEFGRQALMRRLGELAKQRREEIGLGRAAFAKEAKLGSDKTVFDFEFGKRVPTPITQSRLERALGWRLGAIDDTLRLVDRKVTSIQMEELDAEDSLFIAKESGHASLALIPDEELLAEVARRMRADRRVQAPLVDGQGLYGLAASTNSEHLEDEDGEPV